jgi:hypothetical protein
MTKKSRLASAMIGAAVVTAGVGFAPIAPAYADTGQGTVTTSLAARQSLQRHEGPLQRLAQFVERLFHPTPRRVMDGKVES